jgi:hypothetical protein
MAWRRALPALLLLPVLGACGSGGGGTTEVTPHPDPPLFVEQSIEMCLVGAAEETLALVAALEPLVNPEPGGGGPTPTVTLESTNPITNTLFLSIDLEPDGTTDVNATLQFTNGSGGPALSAVAFTNLATSTQGDPAAFLAGLPAGTHAVLAYSLGGPPPISGVLDFTLDAGTITSASGSSTVMLPDCDATVSFEDVTPEDVFPEGSTPVLETQFLLDTDFGPITGTLTFDGTTTAHVTALYFGVVYEFLLDLETGDATPVV